LAAARYAADVRKRALEPRMARLFSAIKALKAYIAQFGRRKRLSLRRKERIGDSRRIVWADEVHCAPAARCVVEALRAPAAR